VKIGELFFTIGAKSEGFEKTIGEAKKSTLLFAAELTAALYAVDRFVEGSTKGATALLNLSKQTDMSARDLQKFGLAASIANAGISAEEASKQVAGFSKNLYELQNFGSGNAGGFNALGFLGRGIDFYGKSTVQVLNDLRQKLQGLNDQQSTNILEKFGFTPEFLTIFRASNEEFDRFAESVTNSDQVIDSLNEANKAINKLKISLGFMQDQIVAGFAPALTDMADGFTEASDSASVLDTMLKGIAISMVGISQTWAAAKTAIGTTFAQGINLFSGGGLGDDIAAVASEKFAKDNERYRKTIRAILGGNQKTALPTSDSALPYSAPDISTSGAEGIAGLYPELMADKNIKSSFREQFSNQNVNKNVSINNTITIHGGDADSIANTIVDKTQQQHNWALSDQGNGGR